ncbi:dual specificity phosphatase [Neurospora hispaniola]|uniref:protein-tyrosine-phosphatase n=1 Tax=Neurospora hispaniola TaxID=588809 RepID=A0AAJ0IAJ2_9PEZI|nr:dual specificity phosphatase [Neurospora hispaniola]
MPSATTRRLYEDQIPSFMSVYDLGPEGMDQQSAITVVDPQSVMHLESEKLPGDTQPAQLRSNAMHADAAHNHHNSTSSRATESAESSPTTTVSCTDSSDLSDPSPSSSPDSPVNLIPLSTLAPMQPFTSDLSRMASLSVSDPNLGQRPMTSPAPRRPKNMKGLSIQPPFNSLASSLVSEPSSPSFIKPTIPGMKRKPSLLSLKTNTSELMNRTTLEVPPSPSVPPILQRRALKHSASTPHMLSGLKSATFGPAGGMTIPTVLERNESGLSEFFRPSRPLAPSGLSSTILEEEAPIKAQVANKAIYEVDPYHEVENNEDQKSPGYPDGPVCIYNDNVYLYLEPTAEEAARFDVVINVAREVSNPFKVGMGSKKDSNSQGRPDIDSPVPDTAATTCSFATAFEFIPESDTPTTPKAQSLKEPEYIHIPWDHNTDIGNDLMTLCEMIDKRTKEGKKVLVHCQQGASRSASLIIAYGMYQNPDLTVNDAYHAAQAKSRWISPNMRLMYCLQDFQKEVSKRKLMTSSFKPRLGRSPSRHRMTLSVDNIDLPVKQEPLTAPLPREDVASKHATPNLSPTRGRGHSTPKRGEPISPGPSSAPSSFSWAIKEDERDPGRFGRFNVNLGIKSPEPDRGRPSTPSPPLKPKPSRGLFAPTLAEPPKSPGFGPPLEAAFSKPPPSPGFGAHRFGSQAGFGFVPLTLGAAPTLGAPPKRKVSKDATSPERHMAVVRDFEDAALMSPRAETMTANPLHEPFAGIPGMQFVEVPPTPGEGLFSPREALFPRDTCYPFGRPKQVADPRSPPTKGETPIVRSIDELL